MFNREPATIINGLAELLKQILPMLVVLGIIHLTSEKLAALISIVGLTLTFVSTILIRTQVAPKQDIQTALDMKAGSSVKDLEKEIAKQN